MDCEAYRQAIGADPRGGFEGAAEHTAGCAACRALTAELLALDERIARALAIDAPAPALPDLEMAAGGAVVELAPRRRRPSAPVWLALAAGLALVAVFALRGLTPGDAYHDQLAGEVLAHMDHEQSSRVVTTIPVSNTALDEVLHAKVSAFDTGGPIVSYAQSCVINGHIVPHLVVQGRTGPITVILLPDENVEDVIPLSGESVHGFILPAESGGVAIIGQREEQMPEVGEVGERVVDSVKWSL
ncbi:MAG TPA: DUF3379 family protein [Woeseiaceae bacterium]